jgi:hypothetical protein
MEGVSEIKYNFGLYTLVLSCSVNVSAVVLVNGPQVETR